MVGSEGTLGVVLEAKINLVPLPKAKAVLAIQFRDLLEALAATPAILQHKPSAVEVMDKFILDNTKQSPRSIAFAARSSKAIPARCCVSSSTPTAPTICRRAWTRSKRDLRAARTGYHFHHALDLPGQATHLEPARSGARPFDGA